MVLEYIFHELPFIRVPRNLCSENVHKTDGKTTAIDVYNFAKKISSEGPLEFCQILPKSFLKGHFQATASEIHIKHTQKLRYWYLLTLSVRKLDAHTYSKTEWFGRLGAVERYHLKHHLLNTASKRSASPTLYLVKKIKFQKSFLHCFKWNSLRPMNLYLE